MDPLLEDNFLLTSKMVRASIFDATPTSCQMKGVYSLPFFQFIARGVEVSGEAAKVRLTTFPKLTQAAL